MNVGEYELVDEPDYETNPFGFYGINFVEFGDDSLLVEDRQIPTQEGVTLADVNTHYHKEVRLKESPGIKLPKWSSGGKRLTLQWWKVYVDSCAT